MPRDRAKTKTGVTFTRQSAEEIAEVIRAARGGNRNQPPSRLPTAMDRGPLIVRGTFVAPWAKGATTTVTDAVNPGVTYTAKNYFAGLSGSTTKACAIANVGTEWILIAAEC
jgi:hypothetical protein